MYKEKKYWDVLDKATLVGELCQGKKNTRQEVSFMDYY